MSGRHTASILSDEYFHSLPQDLADQARVFNQIAEAVHRRTSASAGAGASAGSEGRNLEEWARQHDALISPEVIDQLPLVANETSEHEVHFRETDQRAVKRTWAGFYGQVPVPQDGKLGRRNATPAEYLRRMALQAAVFGSDLRFEGVSVSAKPSLIIGQPAGEPSLVISQAWIEKQGRATNEAISRYLRDLGFTPAPDSYFGWSRPDGIVLVDAKPDNFIQTADGIVPLDLQMAEFTAAELAQAGLPGGRND